MEELDRLVVVLLDRFPLTIGGQPNDLLQKHVNDYLSLRSPSFSEDVHGSILRFEKNVPPFLRTLVYTSCIDDPDATFKSGLRFHRAALCQLRSLGRFDLPSEFVFGSQMNPVFIRRWMRNAIRSTAVVEARAAELEGMQIQLEEEVKALKAEKQHYDAKGISNPPLGKHERQGIRMLSDCTFAFQEVSRRFANKWQDAPSPAARPPA
jgi:hypothetical protein